MRCVVGPSGVHRQSGSFNDKKITLQEYVDIRGLVVDTCGRATYRITARPQFHVKLAARGGRATTARSVAPEIVFGRGRAPSEAAPQSPCGSVRAPASRPSSRLRQRTRVLPPERRYNRTARLHGARISVARRPRAASGALPARWPPCSGGGAWRCCGWSRSARLPPARSVSARRHRPPQTPPRKMRPRRRHARPALVRPPTLPNRHHRRCHPQPIHLRTLGGGGEAHAWVPLRCCAPRARWFARICAAALPRQPRLQTPCSRYKCRGAREWSGWARRGDRACGTTTGTTIPRWNGKNNRDCRRWSVACRKWWSRRRARGPLQPRSASAYRPAYSSPTASTGRTHTYNYESLISKPS